MGIGDIYDYLLMIWWFASPAMAIHGLDGDDENDDI